MERIEDLNRNPYSGIYWSFDPPAEWLESGDFLSIEDFHNTCAITGQGRGEGTYAFNYLLISMVAAEHPDDDSDHKISLALKDPFAKDKQFFVSTQAALDFYEAYLEGKVGLRGYGAKTLRILQLTLYDEEIDVLEEE